MILRHVFDLYQQGETIPALVILFSEIFVIFCCLPVHEFAHAWTAYRLGDDTARLQGRLTLSPMRHLDPFGLALMLIAGFGYAKPVPVNIRNFKNRKRDFALVSLAGPLSNLLMSLLFFIISNVLDLFPRIYVCAVMSIFFYYIGYINVSLAVFNLLPIPPLDGSRILGLIIPDKYYYTILQYERYIRYALLLLIFAGAFSNVLSTLTDWVSNGVEFVAYLPFRFFG